MNTQQAVAEKTCHEERVPRRILFVCTGNTCRSPMAAALLRELSRPREVCSVGEGSPSPAYLVSSAGLYAREGEPITPAAADALRAAGVVATPDNDYPAHTARNVREEMVEEADEVVGLTAAHAMELLMRFPQAATKIRTLPMDIPDPYGGDAEVYRTCLAQLRYALELAYFTGEQL